MKFAWKERFQLLRYFTFTRAYNAFKLYLSYSISRLLKRPWIKGLPISIAYEPTTSCNLRCPECPSGLRSFSRPIGNANLDEFKKLIDQVKDHVVYLTLYFQGEPYLNPDLFEMIDYANKAKLYTSTSTNAHFLDDETCKRTVRSGLNKIIISLDGITEESYKTYRVGGELQKVKQGVKNLVTMKKKLNSKTPFIIIQTIAFSHNENELDEIRALKDLWGVDEVVIKTAQVYQPEQSILLPSDPSLSRYQFKDGKYVIEQNLPNHCWRLWSSPVITQVGQMLPCCFDKDGDHSMGNPVEERSFSAIWNNKKYSSFRSQLMKDRSSIDICKNCSEGAKVWN